MKEILDIEVSNEFRGLFRNKEIEKASSYCDWVSLIEYRFEDTFDRENYYEENCEDEEEAKERYNRFTDRQKLLVDMLSIGKNVDAIFFINNFREASEYIINRYDTHFINDEKRSSCLERLEKLKA